MNRILDAAVLGAGIAGSSTAKYLADKGWEVALIDRRQFPRHKVCGEFLSPEAQSILKPLGLHELVESLHPSTIHRASLTFGYGGALDIPLPGAAFGISRYALDSALHRAASSSGVQVQTGTNVTSVVPHGSGYTIEMKQGGERKVYQARTVIAAWGTNSRVGDSRDGTRQAMQNTYIGVKSHFRGIAMEPVVELYFFEGGYLGISPVADGVVNAAALLNRKAFQTTEKTILGLIESASRRNPKLYQRLAEAVPIPGTQAAAAPVPLKGKPLAWDLFPYVGDAAIMIPPLCGDGMSMALRSALLCARLANRYLSGEISLSSWRSEYTESIRREFKSPLQWGRLLQGWFSLPVVPRLLLGAARIAPGLAYRLVKATRLRERE
ncbi:NAD(P)/FAD-dependent oxidoreductase [Paenibacillus sp. y28]|uniref:NAD(P)/FAD-dependent oxidoreductase n=1 Tax=Paenibacillus sp. y28 TaxID=3129110 RepID=UPI0030196B0B